MPSPQFPEFRATQHVSQDDAERFAQTMNRLTQIVTALCGSAGIDGFLGPTGLHIAPQHRGSRGFWAEITGNTEADSPAQNRWKYSWKEITKASAGYDGWDDAPEQRTGTHNAYNLIEDMNTKTGGVQEGIGVDPDNLDTDDYTFTIQAIPAGVIVWMYEVIVPGTDAPEYWFHAPNGVDGGCDE